MFSENKINVSITNIIVQNGGDAAIMLGMIAALRTVWKDCFVTVFSESPEFCEKFYPDLQSGKTYGRIAVESKISHLRFIGRRYVELKKKWYLVCGWLFSKGLPMCLLPVSGQSEISPLLNLLGKQLSVVITLIGAWFSYPGRIVPSVIKDCSFGIYLTQCTVLAFVSIAFRQLLFLNTILPIIQFFLTWIVVVLLSIMFVKLSKKFFPTSILFLLWGGR